MNEDEGERGMGLLCVQSFSLLLSLTSCAFSARLRSFISSLNNLLTSLHNLFTSCAFSARRSLRSIISSLNVTPSVFNGFGAYLVVVRGGVVKGKRRKRGKRGKKIKG